MKKFLKMVIINILLILTIILNFNIKVQASNQNNEKQDIKSVSSKTTKRTKEDGVYKISIGRQSDKSFELPGGTKENNSRIGIWSYGNAAWQKFYFEYKDGYYKITSMHTGKSLTAKNNSIKEGTEIVQTDYAGSDGQKWILRDSNKNGWVISPMSNTDLSITIQGTIQNGSKLILSKTKDNDNQMLYLYDINSKEKTKSEGIYKVTIGKQSDKGLEVSGNNKDNNAKVGIWTYGNVAWQKFYFEYKDGYYKITAMHTGKSLTAKNNNIKEGSEIVQLDYTGSDGQKWILRDSNKNGWIISPLCNPELSITVQGTIKNGSKLILSKTKDNDNQMLYLFNINNEEKNHENDKYRIAVGKSSDKSFELPGGTKENNSRIGLWSYGNATWQHFYFEYKDGYYKITAMHTNKSLTAKNNSIKEGTEIVQANYVGSDGQKWILRDSNKNGWIISPLCNPELSMTVQGTIQNGSKIVLSKTKDNDNQMFYIMDTIEKGIKQGTYGTSGLMYKGTGGTYLKYYQIGTGSKHLFLNFSIHGFEDSYSKDGSELTYLANELFTYLKKNMTDELIQKCTIYILPLSNPDGQYNGWTNNGPGRTTLYSWAGGHKGIDMNRCFPIGYTSTQSERNYNGTEPMQAFEAQHLRNFILNNTGSQNIVIDVHGWLNETLGNSYLGSFYRNQFGITKHIDAYGNGYFIQWARTIPNTRSMLLELPEVSSHQELIKKNYVSKFNKATMDLLKNY